MSALTGSRKVELRAGGRTPLASTIIGDVTFAASGMCDAGRIRKRLKRRLWRKETTVLLSGFQAVGTSLAASCIGALALGLAGCATTGEQPAPKRIDAVGGAISQPFKDLGVIRPAIPEVLATAASAPYALNEPVDCAVLAGEVAALDTALGPDLNARAAGERNVAEGLALDAFQGALSLPFRGVIRKLTGADRRDRLQVAAVLAGMVRRGYLRGVIRGAGCPQGQAD